MTKLIIAVVTTLALVTSPVFAKGHKGGKKPHITQSAQLI